MTSTSAGDEVLKQDRRGRGRVPRERREALLEEFSRSGLSAAEFARMAGIKYPTFANWRQERRKARPPVVEDSREVLVGGPAPPGKGAPARQALRAIARENPTGGASPSSSGSSSFSSSIPTDELVLWFKADQGVTVAGGDQVSAWADQSGKGNDVTQSSGTLGPRPPASILSLGTP